MYKNSCVSILTHHLLLVCLSGCISPSVKSLRVKSLNVGWISLPVKFSFASRISKISKFLAKTGLNQKGSSMSPNSGRIKSTDWFSVSPIMKYSLENPNYFRIKTKLENSILLKTFALLKWSSNKDKRKKSRQYCFCFGDIEEILRLHQGKDVPVFQTKI